MAHGLAARIASPDDLATRSSATTPRTSSSVSPATDGPCRWSWRSAAARARRDRRGPRAAGRRRPARARRSGALQHRGVDAGEARRARRRRPRAGAGPRRRTASWALPPADRAPVPTPPRPPALRRPCHHADELTALDVARWRPEVADVLMNAAPPRPRCPRTARPRGRRLAARATPCRRSSTSRSTTTAARVRRTRSDAAPRPLAPLDRAARRGVWWPPARPLRTQLASARMRPMDAAPAKTLLITLTGKDRPGVTSTVFATLAAFGVEVLDIEQIVLRRRLILGLLVSAPRDWKALRGAMEKVAADLGMQRRGRPRAPATTARPEGRSHVTVLGTPLQAAGGRGHRRPDRRHRREHRPDRADGALPGHRHRPARLRRRPRPAARRCWPRRPPARASTSPCSPPTCCAAACG